MTLIDFLCKLTYVACKILAPSVPESLRVSYANQPIKIISLLFRGVPLSRDLQACMHHHL